MSGASHQLKLIPYGEAHSQCVSARSASRYHAQMIAELVRDFVDRNYTDSITLRDVAAAVGYSACHLTTKFREETGTPVYSWILKRRIVKAQELLSDGEDIVTVCAAAGFNDLGYFRRQFVRHVGIPPGRFRSEQNVRVRGRT
jgi:AraC-like DNA-binding protein